MTLTEKLESYEADSGVMLADGFDDAFIGIGRQASKEPFAVYDREKCIEVLVRKGMDHDEAEEYFEFNVQCAWIGNQTPIFLEKL